MCRYDALLWDMFVKWNSGRYDRPGAEAVDSGGIMHTQLSENIDQRTDYTGLTSILWRMILRLQMPLFVLAIGLLLAYGWHIRAEEYLTAESGLGYALGIVGGVLMLSQFLYPLRKKLRWLRNWGRIAVWFKAHMAVGIIGPLLILYHANFGLGSINSNVALGAMALVVFSGLIGRYIFTKINQTLYGRVLTLEELKSVSAQARQDVHEKMVMDVTIMDTLQQHETEMLKVDQSWWFVFPRLALLGTRTRLMRWRLKRRLRCDIKALARQNQWGKKELRMQIKAGKRHIDAYVMSVRKVAEYRIYQRIFSLWHVLHIPLFFMLVTSGIVHIVAVHLY